jgi:hypothetical protein
MPENASVEALRAFNTARSASKRAAVLSTLEDLSAAGGAQITKSSVARMAGVSRQFIHSHPDLVQRIEKAGTQPHEHRSGGGPKPDRTVTGLRTQLDTLAAKVQRQKQTIEEQGAQVGSLLAQRQRYLGAQLASRAIDPEEVLSLRLDTDRLVSANTDLNRRFDEAQRLIAQLTGDLQASRQAHAETAAELVGGASALVTPLRRPPAADRP